MKVGCPNCRIALEVFDHLAGQQAKCSQCGCLFRVPAEIIIPSHQPVPVHSQQQWPQEPIQISLNMPPQPPPIVHFNERPRLQSGGWFARSFSSAAGVIMAILFFFIGLPILGCTGLMMLGSFRASQHHAQDSSDLANVKQLAIPELSKRGIVEVSSDLLLRGYGKDRSLSGTGRGDDNRIHEFQVFFTVAKFDDLEQWQIDEIQIDGAVR